MITPKLVAQAIKETAEGMLSGDPDYAAKCVTTCDGRAVRVFMYDNAGDLQYAFRIDDGTWRMGFGGGDFIPTKRTLKCWVRWYSKHQDGLPAIVTSYKEIWPKELDDLQFEWLTDPVEVVLQEKKQP